MRIYQTREMYLYLNVDKEINPNYDNGYLIYFLALLKSRHTMVLILTLFYI